MWAISTCPGYTVMRTAPHLCGLSPLNPYAQSNHEKNIKLVPTEGHSTKQLNSRPQHGQGHQKQGKSEKPSQPRAAEGDTGLHVTWMLDEIPTQKRTLDKN